MSRERVRRYAADALEYCARAEGVKGEDREVYLGAALAKIGAAVDLMGREGMNFPPLPRGPAEVLEFKRREG